MDRLSILLTLMTGSVLTGVLVIAFFSVGWYAWPPVVGAAIVGVVLAWPVGYVISRRIKQRDPDWSPRRTRPGLVPKPGAPEL